MTKINKTEQRTIEVISNSFFTFVGDSQFRTYRQARSTLTSLTRKGLVKREDHDQNMYVLTNLGRETLKYPNVSIDEIRGWAS